MSTTTTEVSEMLLEIRDLTKIYRRGTRANDGVSLSVEEGQTFGLLGHNGAGKTTLVNQVVGLLAPTSGTIRLDGRDAVDDPAFARRACSIQPQAQVPISGITPRQSIEMIGRLRGGHRDQVRRRSEGLIDALDIGEWGDTDGERLSGGVRRLTSFCMAAVVPGRLLILDEPTNDVDPVRRRLLWDQVRALGAEGVAVLLVTHNVLEAERAVDHMAILDRGRVIAEGSPAALKSTVADDLRLELVLEPGRSLDHLPPFVRGAVPAAGRVAVTVPRTDASAAVRWADGLQRAGTVEEFALGATNLEDVYVELVGRADALATAPDLMNEAPHVRVA